MNIKVAAFTVSEKSINSLLFEGILFFALAHVWNKSFEFLLS